MRGCARCSLYHGRCRRYQALLFLPGFALHGRQFGAVTEELPDQVALRVDRVPLLNDQHRHQAVSQHEENNEKWKPGLFRFRQDC